VSATVIPDLKQDAIDAARDAVPEFGNAGPTPPRRLRVAVRRPVPGAASATDEAKSPVKSRRPDHG